MNVKELIEMLQACEPTARVYFLDVYGCSPYFEVDTKGKIIEIGHSVTGMNYDEQIVVLTNESKD